MRALRSMLFVGALALSAGAAHAAQIGVSIGIGAPVVYAAPEPVAYAPPCPGPGYSWVQGYYVGRAWYPGRWVAAQEWREHEWREHEWREHDRWDHDRDYDHDRRDHDHGDHRGWYR